MLARPQGRESWSSCDSYLTGGSEEPTSLWASATTAFLLGLYQDGCKRVVKRADPALFERSAADLHQYNEQRRRTARLSA
jgi:hypothetical protein